MQLVTTQLLDSRGLEGPNDVVQATLNPNYTA